MKTFRVASLQIESSNAPISQTGVQTLPSHALAIVGFSQRSQEQGHPIAKDSGSTTRIEEHTLCS